MNMIRTKFHFSFVWLSLLVIYSPYAFAGMAEDLNLDYVCTFDDIADWTGRNQGDVFCPDYVSDMPKKLDGSDTIWQYYSRWASGSSAPWITNHGAGNVIGNQGKSLILDYSGARGPSRLGCYIGEGSPQTGYNDVFIFYMVKIPTDFFHRYNGQDDLFDSFDYCKFFMVGSGFRSVWEWGTPDEQSRLVNTTQPRNVYGLNFLNLNLQAFTGTGRQVVSYYNRRVSNDNRTNYYYAEQTLSTANVSQFLMTGEWFGIEYHIVRGTSSGSNGSLEIWIYDQQGNVVSTWSRTDVMHMRFFDHRYNKFVLGGNKSFSSSSNHLYIDDFIYDGNRIGPSYFHYKNHPTNSQRLVPQNARLSN